MFFWFVVLKQIFFSNFVFVLYFLYFVEIKFFVVYLCLYFLYFSLFLWQEYRGESEEGDGKYGEAGSDNFAQPSSRHSVPVPNRGHRDLKRWWQAGWQIGAQYSPPPTRARPHSLWSQISPLDPPCPSQPSRQNSWAVPSLWRISYNVCYIYISYIYISNISDISDIQGVFFLTGTPLKS